MQIKSWQKHIHFTHHPNPYSAAADLVMAHRHWRWHQLTEPSQISVAKSIYI